MAFEWRYINRQVFKSSVAYTLLVENSDEEAQSYRIEKSFNAPLDSIDEEFLRKEAKLEIKRITEELTNPFVLPDEPVEEPVDDAIS